MRFILKVSAKKAMSSEKTKFFKKKLFLVSYICFLLYEVSVRRSKDSLLELALCPSCRSWGSDSGHKLFVVFT